MAIETCLYCHQSLPNQTFIPNDSSKQTQPFLSAKVVESEDEEHGDLRLTTKILSTDDKEEASSTSAYPASLAIEQNRNEETEYIHSETRRLDALIPQLHYQRATLQRRLNKIHSPSYTLPPEVLSVIFEHACAPPYSEPLPSEVLEVEEWVEPEEDEEEDGDDDDDGEEDEEEEDEEEEEESQEEEEDLYKEKAKARRHPQLTVGAVSFYWRQVAWSSPRLWTSIHLLIRNQQSYKSARILRLFLENSGDHPLNLNLDWGSSGRPSSAVDDLIFENLPRIQELRLARQPMGLWSTVYEPLPQLTTLSIDRRSLPLTSRRRKRIFYLHSPLLSHFSLQCAAEDYCPELDLSWSTITVVSLRSVPLQTCIELLVKCPNLIEYSCIESTIPCGVAEYPSLPDPFVLEHLIFFGWDIKLARAAALFNDIRLPSLRTLLLYGKPGSRPPPPSFKHLPSTLRTLHLHGFRRDSQAFFGIVDHFCATDHPSVESVEHLILENDPYSDVFNYLLGTFSFRPHAGLLPNLKRVTIRHNLGRKDTCGNRYTMTTATDPVDVILGRATTSCTGRTICLAFEGLREEWEVLRTHAVRSMLGGRGAWKFEIIEERGRRGEVTSL